MDKQEESKLAYYLVTNLCDKASGRGDSECVRNYPRDVYFIGNLRPTPNETVQKEDKPKSYREIINKLSPMAFGSEFLIHIGSEPIEIEATVNWTCYYRVFPTYLQQCEHQHKYTSISLGTDEENSENIQQYNIKNKSDSELEENDSNDNDPPEDHETPKEKQRARVLQDTLFIRFRKICCTAKGRIAIKLDKENHIVINDSNLQIALKSEFINAQKNALTDIDILRTNDKQDSKAKVPDSALMSEEAYKSFLKTLNISVVPEWNMDLCCNARGTDISNEFIFAFELVNTSPTPESSPNHEPFLFDSKASFIFAKKDVKPFNLELAPRNFRYNKTVWGRGINCDITLEKFGDKSLLMFVTTHVPIYSQLRYSTREVPSARFIDLAKDPMTTLDAILKAMEGYREIWDIKRQDYVNGNSSWEDEYGKEFDKDKQYFNDEIKRFSYGCELIRTIPDIREAFKLTNETFSRGVNKEWRLFQIIFLVCQIPGIMALSHSTEFGISEREQVDIIYFPTGGGKTEAYLATIVFHCFYDRLRGKKAGVTAWTRFPLRLLTLQQTQRVVDIIGLAEIVRTEHNDPRLSGDEVDGFAVGYFVGQGGSPNELVNPEIYRYATYENKVNWSKANDLAALQGWKRIARCPSCKTATISLEFDSTTNRLIHRCNQPNCKFPKGELPIYIVDNEIFRYLPSVIVGTIDKLAGLGNQRKFAMLFGQVDGRCSIHGYYKAQCCQKDCTAQKNLIRKKPEGITGPTLFVQDELHLLKEGLGTFDGHYETFTQTLLSEYGYDKCLKIIASSATIEAFERQVNHLYGRRIDQARVFPGKGPALGESFYAQTLTYPQRLYVGIIPHNKTIFNTILELIELYHREVQVLQTLSKGELNPYGGKLIPGTPEWQQILDLYSTSLTYFSASRDLDSIRTDLEGDVIPNLIQDRMKPLRISELTGSTLTDEVSKILEKLESTAILDQQQDAVLATSMVSHGVDINRLNSMIFYGMPRLNSEYIQASSRVGRSHVGIVFTCLHPIRERDQSHYAYFIKYHEFLGQLVEPVAINRWSRFSVNRTLPGLFMAVLLQLIANNSGNPKPGQYSKIDFVRRLVSNGSLKPEHFIPILEDAYRVQNPSEPGMEAFCNEIHLRVRQYLDWILSPSNTLEFVSDVLVPKPMKSLRDVDETIPIELDSIGTQWTTNSLR